MTQDDRTPPYNLAAAFERVKQDPFDSCKDDTQRHIEALMLVVEELDVSRLKEHERDELRRVLTEKANQIASLDVTTE
ncbi:hypothetical protein [Stutzerimonas stutzeri]|uniref:hypothetical protein n=1 Tax=Stutzerimonas stutzeri TaxID=316 RepID=UPI0015E3EBE7|nr:hypothetical protein [Stutzerimonas stutzeri]MBA1280427.1 hypothetical protein [Stutzerimonas stutzeri]